MSDYDNTNRGVLFKNDRKTSDRHPDFKGHMNVDGVERWLSAWTKKPKDGKTFVALSLGEPREQQPQRKPDPVREPDPFDDEVPF